MCVNLSADIWMNKCRKKGEGCQFFAVQLAREILGRSWSLPAYISSRGLKAAARFVGKAYFGWFAPIFTEMQNRRLAAGPGSFCGLWYAQDILGSILIGKLNGCGGGIKNICVFFLLLKIENRHCETPSVMLWLVYND